jgi:FMN phosphatase YigB (HAD superfamily)
MRAKEFIKAKPSRILTIFDIDDTLFHTTAKIKVVKDGEVVRTLTNQEFNNYELQDGEDYDFGEFRNAEKSNA